MSATCKSCSAAIEWVRVATTGKMMPLDLEPRPDGNLVVEHGLVHPALDGDSAAIRRVSHFATCPQAASWRQR